MPLEGEDAGVEEAAAAGAGEDEEGVGASGFAAEAELKGAKLEV